eukprot:UN00208
MMSDHKHKKKCDLIWIYNGVYQYPPFKESQYLTYTLHALETSTKHSKPTIHTSNNQKEDTLLSIIVVYDDSLKKLLVRFGYLAISDVLYFVQGYIQMELKRVDLLGFNQSKLISNNKYFVHLCKILVNQQIPTRRILGGTLMEFEKKIERKIFIPN